MMQALHVATQGAHVSREGDRLIAIYQHRKLTEIPVREISLLCLFGNVEITTSALTLCMSSNIDVCFLSLTGKLKGRVEGSQSARIRLRRSQFQLDSSIGEQPSALAMDICRAFVSGKVANCATVLRRTARYRRNETALAIAEDLRTSLAVIECANSLASLRGYEGIAAKRYFKGFRQLIPANFEFSRRIRRPPKDPVNILLSLGYTILAQNINAAVNITGFEPHLGLYHCAKPGRPALALDLMEEFRPVMVDACVLSAINRGVISTRDFDFLEGRCQLRSSGLADFLGHLNNYMDRRVSYPRLGIKTTYRTIILRQAQLLASVIIGEKKAYQPFKVR